MGKISLLKFTGVVRWSGAIGIDTASGLAGVSSAARAVRRTNPRQSKWAALRACFKIPWGPVFGEKAGWRGATKENIPSGSLTEEQQSQAAFSPKTLRAAGL